MNIPKGKFLSVQFKKVFLIIGLSLGILSSIVLINTARFDSKQIKVEKAEDIKFNKEIVSHLANAICFKTISYENKLKRNWDEFHAFHKYLENTFPNVHRVLKKEVINNASLLFTWEGNKTNSKPVLLIAHMDVVPIEPNTEKKWKHPPFEGKIADGYIWGRGTMDNKVSIIGILEAVELLVKSNFKPNHTIYLAFGHDEEIGGKDGAGRISSLLKSRGIEFECVIDEGLMIISGIMPGLSSPVALIGIAEKGYLSVELNLETQGGHSATPPNQTAIGILSRAICKLEEKKIHGRIKGPVQQMIEYTGPELPFYKKIIFANLWLFSWLIENEFTKSPAADALIRTTIAPTIFKSGIKDNILPTKAKAIVNFRINQGENINSVIEYIHKTINDPRIKIKISGDGYEPSPVTSLNSQSFKIIQQTITEVFPKAIVAPSLFVGTTDSRYYNGLSKNIYRFLPLEISRDDISKIHGINECVSINNYEKIVQFYIQLIRNLNIK